MFGIIISQSVLILILSSTTALTLQTIDIQSYLDSLDNGLLNKDSDVENVKDNYSNQIEESLADTWGIPDQIAVAGRLFKFRLPEEVTQNGDSSFKIVELESGELPDWVFFDEFTKQILGIPSEEQIGRQHYLEVTSNPKGKKQLSEKKDEQETSKDMFSIKIIEDSDHINAVAAPIQITNDSSENAIYNNKKKDTQPSRIKCTAGSSITKATVIIDVDTNDLLPKQIVDIMENFGRHLNIPTDLLRMIPVGDRPMFDSSALVAGEGDKKEASSPGTLLQWEVGCGNVQAYHMPILQQLESTASEGSMSQALGQDVLGWQVTNNRPTQTSHRLKRRAVNPHHSKDMNTRLSRRAAKDNDLYDEEGSGFFSPTDGPLVEEEKPRVTSPTDPIRPTKTRKPHKTRTRKPRPTKTNGRHHHHRTKHPTPTDPVVPTTPVVSPTRTKTVIMPTTKPDRIQTTPSLPDEVKSGPVATPSLPIGKNTNEGINTRPIRPTPSEMPAIPEDVYNYAPKVDNDMPRIEVKVGDILNYRIPASTFYDKEDGDTRDLKLTMLTNKRYNLENNSWVQFDNESQTIIGIPMDVHIGTYEYIILALDSSTQMVKEHFEIKVSRRPPAGKINHEFSVKLDLNYNRFVEDVNQRIDVVSKIAKVYGDKDLSKITVTKVEKGSVDFAWTNNSMPTDGCPVADIKKLLGFLVNDNNSLNSNFVKGMKPYTVLGAGAFPKGSCIENWSTTTAIDPKVIIIPTDDIVIAVDPFDDIDNGIIDNAEIDATDNVSANDDDDDAIKARESSQDDKFVTTIIPVVVITTMLLLAIIIACCLYRKNRKGKMSDEDHGTFVSKGIPVIFADELEEKPDPPSKPLIMSEEKPPLPPPEYPRSNSGGSMPSTPGSGHREPLLEGDRYNRPPPVSAGGSSSGSMGRRLPKTPNQQPQYRQPPPYASIPP